ncbi:hypothetical protein AcW1_006944 [Taiwanofungus camphoratus]|nr:hypothetical protein AcV5_002755 [Antrodia cinnamomea]KAI0924997.1 hypothetical protein AcW2_005709 [Antrodia cinnamomea]KAI0955332.1 hypothetical protein AcW1_006944 [Antrodia cinnamomea]
MSSVASPFIGVHVFDSSFGAVLVGVVFQAIFYGNVSTSMWEYQKHYRGDPWWHKGIVFAAWVMCTFSLGVGAHAFYDIVIANFKDPYALMDLPWGVRLIPLANGSVVAIVRFMFLKRLWRFCRAKGQLTFGLWSILALTALLSAFHFIGSIVLTVQIFCAGATDKMMSSKKLFEAMISVGVTADVILTGMLCASLNRSRTGLSRTDSMINLLILYTIQTGLLPAMVAIVSLITFMTKAESFLFVPFYAQPPNLYLMSLISALNHREVIRQQVQRPFTIDLSPLERCMASPVEASDHRPSLPTLTFDQDSDIESNWRHSIDNVVDSEKPPSELADKVHKDDVTQLEIDVSDSEEPRISPHSDTPSGYF